MVNSARIAETIGLTNGLSFTVVVEYYDGAAPSAVLWTESFILPLTTTTQELTGRVIERGQTIRDALNALTNAQAAVPRGASVSF